MAFIDGDNGENFMTVMGFPQYATEPKVKDARDYLIAHESGTKDYHLYISRNGRKMSDYKFSEEEILKLYNTIKKVLELENLI